jgi:hypothetical protein
MCRPIVCVKIWLIMPVRVGQNTHTDTHRQVTQNTHAATYTHENTHTHTAAYTHEHTYRHQMHTHTYTHTHTHTHTQDGDPNKLGGGNGSMGGVQLAPTYYVDPSGTAACTCSVAFGWGSWV